jgi:hypothetical protein
MECITGIEHNKRYDVKGNAIVVGNHVGKIINIGLDGMEYRFYETEERTIKPEPSLTILVEKDGFVIYKIPYAIESESESNEIDENGNPVKQSRVKFTDLTNNQVCQLEYFIKKYAS